MRWLGSRCQRKSLLNLRSIPGVLKLTAVTFLHASYFYLKLGGVKRVGNKWDESEASKLTEEQKVLVELVQKSISFANRPTFFPCTPSIRFPVGMSGQRFRAFLHHLSNQLLDFQYLEIGVWQGSTANAVLRGNCQHALLIDNWSEFGGPKRKAKRRLEKFIEANKVTLLDHDFKSISWSKKYACDLYFYDGAHDYNSHFEAMKFLNNLEFINLILIVDDWNWENVKNGTLDGLKTQQVNLIYSFQVQTLPNEVKGRYSGWHNGTWIAIISRQN